MIDGTYHPGLAPAIDFGGKIWWFVGIVLSLQYEIVSDVV